MRIHQIQITAFGPFAGTELIDMDALSASGLFLLEGPTGAGKSTVLDALTFALYAEPASASASADRLHSHFAPPDLTPSVMVDFSVGSQRLRVRREPEHLRPKKTGEGTTKQASSVHLELWESDAWTSLSSNKAEVGSILLEKLGLSRDQFTQVVLLPQGEFANFLRAGDDERRALLTRIFGTQLYDRITNELDERRTEATRARRDSEHGVSLSLAAAAEAAELDDAATTDLTSADSAGRTATLHSIALLLDTAVSNASSALVSAQAALTVATTVCDKAKTTVELQTKLAELTETLELHEAERPAQTRRQSELAAARRAEPAAVLITQLQDAEAAVLTAQSHVRELIANPTAQDLSGASAPTHTAEARGLDSAADQLQHLVDLEKLVSTQASDLEALRTRAAEAATTLEEQRSRARALPEQLRSLELTLSDAGTAAAPLEADMLRLVALERERDAAGELAVLTPTLTAAKRAWEVANDQRRDSVDAYQRLLQRHLEGMAANLAAQLVPGAPCMVCGSVDHPNPAAADEQAVSTQQLEDAAKSRGDAEKAAEKSQRTVEELALRDAALLAICGEANAADIAVAHSACAAAVTVAQHAYDQIPELRSQLTVKNQEREELAKQILAATETASTSQTQYDAANDGLAAATAQLTAARGEHESVANHQMALRESAQQHGLTATAATELAACLMRVEIASDRVNTEASQRGFEDPTALRSALRSPVLIQELDDVTTMWDTQTTTLRAEIAADQFHGVTLGDRDAAELALQAAEAALVDAKLRADQLIGLKAHTEGRARAFNRCQSEVAAAQAEATRVHTETAAVIRLAGLARGTSGQQRVALTTYVLRHWFAQVVAAANIRLAAMSSGRYELVRVDEGERKSERAGLTLKVIDRHTGQSRNPTSLSGGETFYTSLALALGLADVVTAQAGGVELDTLFIDEGFGSLDVDTLDQVMSVIDDLRDRGRAIGIVSHVSELKDRIPERLEISRKADGSSTTKVVA